MNEPRLTPREWEEYFTESVEFAAPDAVPHWIEAEFWLGVRPAVWGLLAMLGGAVASLWVLSRLVVWVREVMQTLPQP